MVKPLAAQLADSVRAKNAEDAAAAAQKQAHDKAIALRRECYQPVERAETKVAADMDAWNAKVAQLKHEISAKQAEKHAEWLEWEASFAIDYAKAAIEEAKSAVLDAIVARIEAEKSQGQLTQPSILPAGSEPVRRIRQRV